MNNVNRNVVIEVDDLIAHYDKREILHCVDLDVYEGEIMVIMGGSGSGKSTLLRYLLGLNFPEQGCVKLLGKDITRLSASELYEIRKTMGVAFQAGGLLSSLTVAENAMLPLREHTKLDEKTMQIMVRMKLEVVNLGGCENLMPAQLSGGMIKRAALARAIVMDPKLLFFDEPSAGLDPVVAAELDELILRLREAMGMTIVVVTHELDSTFKIADRITVLDRGKIIITGKPEEVRACDNPRVQSLLNREPGSDVFEAEAYLDRLTAG